MVFLATSRMATNATTLENWRQYYKKFGLEETKLFLNYSNLRYISIYIT